MAAEEINDLVVQSAERELLYKALRERGLKAERQYKEGNQPEVDLALLCELGNLGISLGDPDKRQVREVRSWQFLVFPEGDVSANLAGVVQKVQQVVRHLGGPARGR